MYCLSLNQVWDYVQNVYKFNKSFKIVSIIFKYLFLREESDRLLAYLFYFIISWNIINSCRVFEEENDVIVRDSNKEESSKSVVPAAASLENLGKKKLKLWRLQNEILTCTFEFIIHFKSAVKSKVDLILCNLSHL